MHIVSHSFNDCYNQLAKYLLTSGEYDVSPRGQRVRESLCVSFKIENPRDRLIYNPARKFSFTYVIAEMLWYISGNNKTSWISHYSKFWNKISDDGKTANSAYGARIFEKNERIAGSQFIQWDFIKEELRKDPDSRRAIIHIRVPEDSIKAKLDVPCTISIQYFIRSEKLHCIVNMRSSDLILGISYDIPAFTFMQEMMANELGVDVGSYMHVSNSLHVYERHFDMLEKIASTENINKSYSLSSGARKLKLPQGDLPIYSLMQFEDAMRKTTHNKTALDLLDSSICLFDDYWNDWLRALAAHRVLKNGDKHLHDNILYRCDRLRGCYERS